MADVIATLISRSEATSLGLKRYFTGVICKKGHISERLVSGGHCVVCSYVMAAKLKKMFPDRQKKYDLAYRKNNPDGHAARARKYRENNREICRERVRQDRIKNRDKRIAQAKKYAAEHPEIVAEQQRRYKDANRDKLRQRATDYRRRNPHKTSIAHNNRRAAKAKSEGSHTASDIRDIIRMQKGKCGYCRTSLNSNHHIDHIVPLSRGGSNDRANLQALCVKCNLEKSHLDPLVFARKRGMML